MTSDETTSGFKILDTVVDRPDQGNFVFINSVIIATFIVLILDLFPGATFLLLPWGAEPGFGGISVAQCEINGVATVNSLELGISGEVVSSTSDRNDCFLNICPSCIISDTIQRGSCVNRISNESAFRTFPGRGGWLSSRRFCRHDGWFCRCSRWRSGGCCSSPTGRQHERG